VIPLHDDNIRPRRLPAVTVALIAVNVAVFVVQLTLPRWGITETGWFYLFGVRPFELTHHVDLPPFAWFPGWATLFTSMFVHGGWLHLIFNMWFLWLFGADVEDAMTRPRYLLFFLVCGMAATATQVLVAAASDVPLVGASGAIAGVLGGYLVLFPRARVLTVIPLIVVWPVFEVPAWIWLVVWFAIQALSGWRSWGSGEAGVAFFAHVGGFVAGMLLVLVLARRRPRRARQRRSGVGRRAAGAGRRV
jgi:membrane associated rhomboid family serine protease